MADNPSHTLLYCKTRRCHSLMVVLPGRWVVVSRLKKGEPSRNGCGTVPCRKCGTQWEVTQAEVVEKVAA